VKRKANHIRRRVDRKPSPSHAEPAPGQRAASPPRAENTPAARARALARQLGDERARAVVANPPPAGQPLAVTAPGDPAEREAERAAEAVTRGAPPAVRRDEAGDGPGVAPPIVHDVLASSGRPLEAGTRERMEDGLGADLGGVRVHTDPRAAESARAVNAHAYTVGSDVVFAQGRYAPGSREGDRLLAHELTHVVQQEGAQPAVRRTIGDGHDLESNRFKGNTELEAAFDGERMTRTGARGMHVTLLQQALVDAGHALPVHGVDGSFGAETRTALRAFQSSKGLTGPDVDGVLGPITMGLLDQHFLRHAPEHAIARNPGRPLMEGTRPLSAAEKAAVTDAITTEPRTAGGALPAFNRTIATHPDPYEVRIAARLNQAITNLHTRLVATRPPRTPGNMMTPADVNRLAARAKTETDAVYGRYRTGPAMSFGVNIFDQFVRRSATIAASPANADWAANWRVRKLLDGDRVIGQIDQEHGAVQARPTEWGLIGGVTGFPGPSPAALDTTPPPHVTTGIVGARRAELLDIHRNWPAEAVGSNVYLRMSLGAGNPANRDIMYVTFATIIHEYIHTLEHANHVSYRRTLADQRGGFVLREGMTDYLAKIVWESLSFDPALRTAIEERFQDPVNPNAHPIPPPPRYGQWVNAERMVGIVGIRNALAAFFLGRTDLIGGP
jgi:peptidoglycan hydrolase-like protein with peptidoglycan-binding domain